MVCCRVVAEWFSWGAVGWWQSGSHGVLSGGGRVVLMGCCRVVAEWFSWGAVGWWQSGSHGVLSGGGRVFLNFSGLNEATAPHENFSWGAVQTAKDVGGSEKLWSQRRLRPVTK